MEDILLLALIGLMGAIAQFDWVKKWKHNRSLEIIRLAVAWTYEHFVRAQKADNQKLTNDQRSAARMAAVRKAYEMAKERNIDLDSILGVDLLEMFVEVAVSKAKGKP